jgi:hypothetical protein
MLELLIALFLVGTYALPLAQLPMKAIREQMKSCYRMQIQRLADLAFAEVKEKLYRQEISWKEISRPATDKATILDDTIEVSLEPLGTRRFYREGTLHSVGKKGKEGEEWRLITFRVLFKPQDKHFKIFRGKKGVKSSHIFTYRALVSTSPTSPPISVAQEGVQTPPTEVPKKN